jgi:serine protease
MTPAVVSLAWILFGCGASEPADVAAFTNDPSSIKQGYMPRLGVSEAWKITRGNVIVAVVDNGIELTHPDLENQIWTNPKESANGIDDDGNGFVDDLHGWDFLDEDSDSSAGPKTKEIDSHGTAVAGIIAAATDNGVGVAGNCPNCQLMVLRARDFDEERTVVPRLAKAIDYAVQQGARVVVISDGRPVSTVDASVIFEIQDAVNRAAKAGTIVVASAGNDGQESVRIPGAIAEVCAVGAVNWDDMPMSWTSYGKEVDISAPGEFVYTTMLGSSYGYFSGTSASAPIAGALAALLLSAHPEMTPAEVITRIQEHAASIDMSETPQMQGLLGKGALRFRSVLK